MVTQLYLTFLVHLYQEIFAIVLILQQLIKIFAKTMQIISAQMAFSRL
jgi:hypothetical protein